MFFQHLSQSTVPPSIWIHLPSSICLSHLAQTLTLGLFFPIPCLESGLPAPRVGLVCDRIGNFGGLLSRGFSPNPSRAGLDVDAAVCTVVSSSKRVSMVRSRAPVDLAAERMEYAVDADRLRFGRGGDTVSYSLRLDLEEDIDGNRTLLVPSAVLGGGGGADPNIVLWDRREFVAAGAEAGVLSTLSSSSSSESA